MNDDFDEFLDAMTSAAAKDSPIESKKKKITNDVSIVLLLIVNRLNTSGISLHANKHDIIARIRNYFKNNRSTLQIQHFVCSEKSNLYSNPLFGTVEIHWTETTSRDFFEWSITCKNKFHVPETHWASEKS
jgi:hypothetical protein